MVEGEHIPGNVTNGCLMVGERDRKGRCELHQGSAEDNPNEQQHRDLTAANPAVVPWGHCQRDSDGEKTQLDPTGVLQLRQFQRHCILGAPPLLPSDVPGEYDFKRRRRPDIAPVDPQSIGHSAPGSIEGHTGQATVGIFPLQLADDKAVEVTNGAYLTDLFVCDMNLKRVFDRENQFDAV